MDSRLLLSILVLAPAFSASLPTARPEEAGMSTERVGRIRAAIQRYIDRQEVAGAVSLVARRGRVVHFESQGLMNLESKSAMKNDAIFRIASMTKPIASVALMMLYEEGHFQLNDPVSKFIPEFKNMKVAVPVLQAPYRVVPVEREVTVRQILTHSAGFPGSRGALARAEFEKAARKPDDTVGDYVKRLAQVPLNCQPGTCWEYGPATDVVGYLVEVISGTTLDKFLAERIFKPLGMTDTQFYVPDGKLPRLATVYTRAEPSGLRPAAAMGRGSQRYFSGAGGLSSTAADYARFCQMLVNGGHLDNARLLSRKTVELMIQNHIGDLPLWPSLPGQRFGLGFAVVTDLGAFAQLGSPGTYNWGGAFGTYFWIDPKEQLFGILMMQLRPYDHVNIRQDVRTLATQAIVD